VALLAGLGWQSEVMAETCNQLVITGLQSISSAAEAADAQTLKTSIAGQHASQIDPHQCGDWAAAWRLPTCPAALACQRLR